MSPAPTIEQQVDAGMAERDAAIEELVKENLPGYLLEQGRTDLLRDDELQFLLDREAEEERDRIEAEDMAKARERFPETEHSSYEHQVYRNPNDPSYRPGQTMTRKKQKEPEGYTVDYAKAEAAMREAERLTEEARADREAAKLERERQGLEAKAESVTEAKPEGPVGPQAPEAPPSGEKDNSDLKTLETTDGTQPGDFGYKAPEQQLDDRFKKPMDRSTSPVDGGYEEPVKTDPAAPDLKKPDAKKPKSKHGTHAKKPTQAARPASKPSVDYAAMFKGIGRVRGLNDAAAMAMAQNSFPAARGLGGPIAGPAGTYQGTIG